MSRCFAERLDWQSLVAFAQWPGRRGEAPSLAA
ncbi:MAG: hypothetical protein RL514_4714 [Verrucomicrobiota bacterium]|jgi:hypothetical protein